MTIDVAGLCVRVNIENSKILSSFRSDYKSFLSQGRPNFAIDIETTDDKKNNFLSDDFGDIAFTQRNNKFYMLKRTDSDQVLGFIDLESQRCLLDLPSKRLFKNLFPAFLRCCSQMFLASSNGFLLHACGIIGNGNGFVFTGASGSGKSTVAGLLKNLTVLSDEFVALKRYKDLPYLYSIPYPRSKKGSAPLKRIFFLRKAKKTTFVKVNSATATREIISNVCLSIHNHWTLSKMLDHVIKVTREVPCYELHFELGSSLWQEIKALD